MESDNAGDASADAACNGWIEWHSHKESLLHAVLPRHAHTYTFASHKHATTALCLQRAAQVPASCPPCTWNDAWLPQWLLAGVPAAHSADTGSDWTGPATDTSRRSCNASCTLHALSQRQAPRQKPEAKAPLKWLRHLAGSASITPGRSMQQQPRLLLSLNSIVPAAHLRHGWVVALGVVQRQPRWR